MSGKVTDDRLRQINDTFDSRDVDAIMSVFTADSTFPMVRDADWKQMTA